MPRQKVTSPKKRTATVLDKTNSSLDLSNDDDFNPEDSKRVKYDLPFVLYKYNTKDEQNFLGKIDIGCTNNEFPTEWSKSKVSFVDNNLKLIFDENIYVIVALSYDLIFLKDIFLTKVFKFNFITNASSVFLYLYFKELPLTKFTKKTSTVMQQLMVQFFQIDVSDVYQTTKLKSYEVLEELYTAVNNYRKEKSTKIKNNINLQHPNLLPKLRPYQHDAVKWMIEKETVPEISKELLHPLFMPITLESGLEIYYNKYIGYIEIEKPLVKYIQNDGILADEMGLGKTVEVLACILNNPRPLEHLNNVNENIDQKMENNSEEYMVQDTNSNENKFEEVTGKNDEEIDQKPNTSLVNSSGNLNDTIPLLDTQIKYRKKKIKKAKTKKSKISTELKSKSKSISQLAAQIWYESKLSEVIIKDKRNTPNSTSDVQCICGDFSRKGIIKCCDCGKKQHALCMGYTKKDNRYSCPQCWTKKPLLKSKATLIVSPQSICRQWSLEVLNHIRKNGLRVLEYKGIHSAGMIYPTDLADYDLVITTYSVLKSELRFTNDEHGSFSLRHAKRYNIPNTPLLCIEWWRLCLDEAQNVEGPTTQVSLMAQQINVVHRWAVTGTPIQKQIEELYSLIEYLHLSPYNDINTWNYMLYYPYINGNKMPMIEFLSKVLWRSAKVDVLDQINIPPQTFEISWLEFSAVEKFFYKREHEFCASNFLTKLKTYNSLDVTLKSIDRGILNTILMPLLSLRQACIHPQAVRGRYLASKRQVKSMEDLLEALIEKNVHECEERLRGVIAALNGMAGVLLLQQEKLLAVEMYREALTNISKYEKSDFLKVDKLQRIHTLYNLNDILNDKSCPEAIPPTLRDDNLKDEYETVQTAYMKKFMNQTATALEEAKKATSQVVKYERKFVLREGEWCSEVVDWFVNKRLEDELVRRVVTLVTDSTCKLKSENITGSKSVLYLLVTWIDNVLKHLNKLRKLFKEFENAFYQERNNNYINSKIVESAMECHLRPAKSKKPPPNCELCILDKKLKAYECIIFQMNHKANKENVSNQGSWTPCIEEKILKLIYTIAKPKNIDEDLLLDGEAHVSLCQKRRVEFKELRKLYTFYYQQVSAQDELNISKIRFRLKNPEEPVKVIQKKIALKNLEYEIENKFEFINVLDPAELDYIRNVLHEDKIANENNLKKYLGTHNYLETLRKQQYAGQSPDPCPICNTQLTGTWSILQCGHCYCLDCIHNLFEQYSNGKYVTCSICRQRLSYGDISYIKMQTNNENTLDDVDIKGSYSTKIHAIIRCVLKLRDSDPDVKVLIFSTWQPVLNIINEAFTANHIKFESISSTGNLQEKLKNFKDLNKNVTALLLPIRLGANGLNLIEATHVILVEPLMNPGEELQAIGRVHRIGQTKPTVVHRFLIKNTMEENIHNATSSNAKQWNDNNLTLAELKRLFVQNECIEKNENVD